MATIDVLLPTRNAAAFLDASINSVVNQTFRDWRLLLLDHGSTDDTLEIAQRFADRDKRVVILENPEARGLGGLLNFGLDKADANIVVRQDGDDISMPNRFQLTADIFSSDPGLMVVGGEAVVINSVGSEIGYIRRPCSAMAVTAASFFINPVAHPTAAFNLKNINDAEVRYGRDVLKVLPPDQSLSIFSLAEDYFLFGQLALLGRCINIKEPLIQYRYHAQSESVSKRSAQNDCALAISRFLARSFAKIKGMPDFDPAPFCTHAECVFDFGQSEYSSEYNRMATALRSGLGSSFDLERELAFRRVLATRSSVAMTARFLRFAAEHGWRSDDYRLVRNWLARAVRDTYAVPISGGVAPWREVHL